MPQLQLKEYFTIPGKPNFLQLESYFSTSSFDCGCLLTCKTHYTEHGEVAMDHHQETGVFKGPAREDGTRLISIVLR